MAGPLRFGGKPIVSTQSSALEGVTAEANNVRFLARIPQRGFEG
jgi:hypothetical protein